MLSGQLRIDTKAGHLQYSSKYIFILLHTKKFNEYMQDIVANF